MAVTRILLRRGTTDEWEDANPVLAQGEPGFDVESRVLKIGDGQSPWEQLPGLMLDAEEYVAQTQAHLPDDSINAATLVADLPQGTSVMRAASGEGGWPTLTGNVVTHRFSDGQAVQSFYASSSSTPHVRSVGPDGEWGDWTLLGPGGGIAWAESEAEADAIGGAVLLVTPAS